MCLVLCSGLVTKMKIGINALYMIPCEVGGTETYLRGLLYGLSKVGQDNEYVILTNSANHDTLYFDVPNFSRYECRCSGRSRFFRIDRNIPENTVAVYA